MILECNHLLEESCESCRSDRKEVLHFMSLRYKKDCRKIANLEFENALLREILGLKESSRPMPLLEAVQSLDEFSKMLEVNLENDFVLSQGCAKQLVELIKAANKKT